MKLLWTVFAALVLSIHIFVIMMETGATQTGTGKKRILALAAIFLVVQLAVQSVGILLALVGNQIWRADLIDKIYRIAYVLLLLGVGFQLISKLRRTELPGEHMLPTLSLKQCARISIGAGAETFLLGLASYHYASPLAYVISVSLGFLAAIFGFSFGYWNGVRAEKALCAVDGVLLFCLVCKAVLV